MGGMKKQPLLTECACQIDSRLKCKNIPHTERATFALKESANAVKCSTGSTQNNDRFVPGTNKDAARFMSHYTDNFKRPAPTGCKHPTTIQCDNGFTKST